MARLARLQLTGHVAHILIRSHNQLILFKDKEDYSFYLEKLIKHSMEQKFNIHAYVLLPEHIHLLGTPKNHQALSKTLQAVGREYTQFFNKKYIHRGTVWDGRFRSNLIQMDVWGLACIHLLELHPVWSGYVDVPQEWLWSSCLHHCGVKHAAWLCDPIPYWALGNTPFERQLMWTQRISEALNPQERNLLIQSVSSGWPIGDQNFLADLAQQTARPIRPRLPGRPSSRPKVVKKNLSPI